MIRNQRISPSVELPLVFEFVFFSIDDSIEGVRIHQAI